MLTLLKTLFERKLSQNFFAKTPFFLKIAKYEIFFKLPINEYELQNKESKLNGIKCLVMEYNLFVWVFKKNLIFCRSKFKKGDFAKYSWLDFFKNIVYTTHSKLLTISLERFLAIFSQN